MQNIDDETIRKEMDEVRAMLQTALKDLIDQYGKKLKPEELQEIKNEVNDLDEMLRRIGSGYVWLALFGKTNVGKSALANSIIGRDEASVFVGIDHTTGATAYEYERWKIVDVPGIMGDKVLQDIAKSEAAKAIGLILVLDGEPYGPEIELFDLIHKEYPHKPKFAFVNKLDVLEYANLPEEMKIVKDRIESKMRKYIGDKPILYGSAYPKVGDEKVRQALPELIALLEKDAGTLGAVMAVLDPAQRALDATASVRKHILDIRAKVARKAIKIIATTSAVALFVPGAQLVIQPSILATMVFVVHGIMGYPITKAKAKDIAQSLLASIGTLVGVSIAGDVLDWLGFALIPFFGVGYALLGINALAKLAAGIGVVYWRLCVLGEVILEYIRLGDEWEGSNHEKIIEECKKRAERYGKLERK